jgi:hypothetical protein
LKFYIDLFRISYNLPYVYEFKCRLKINEFLLINNFHFHWLFSKDPAGNYIITDLFELIQNSTVINPVERRKRALNKRKRNSMSDISTERDFSQFKRVEAAVIEDISKLKGKYRVKRNVERPKIQKSVKNLKRKYQKVETIDLTIDKKICI